MPTCSTASGSALICYLISSSRGVQWDSPSPHNQSVKATKTVSVLFAQSSYQKGLLGSHIPHQPAPTGTTVRKLTGLRVLLQDMFGHVWCLPNPGLLLLAEPYPQNTPTPPTQPWATAKILGLLLLEQSPQAGLVLTVGFVPPGAACTPNHHPVG